MSKKKSVYGVHPGVLMTQKWIGEIKQKKRQAIRICKAAYDRYA